MLKRLRSSTRVNDKRRRVAQSLMRMLFGKPVTLSQEPLPEQGIYRILICHYSHTLGNALLLTPLIQELETIYPGATIDIVTRSQIAEAIYGRYFNVDRLYKLPSHSARHPRTLLRQWRAIRKNQYDLVIDPDPQSQTGRLLLLRANATYKLGFDSPKKSGNVTHAVPVTDAPTSKGKRPVFLLRAALGRPWDMPYPFADIRLSDAERADGRAALQRVLGASGKGKRILGVFANATGPKLLRKEWWLPFLDAFEAAAPDYQCVEIIPAFGRSLLDSRYPAYFSNDLRKLASVLAALDAYTSADCGIMHLSCAARTPTLGIFNTTNAEEWGPYGGLNQIVHAYDMQPADVGRKLAAMLGAPSSVP
ncbi:MAG TPA: glycosyltransferase family 9 protein [Dyella sp.]|uniref:glycosyltransferase family 9 protein n=1 Tax=Dyella sp. TaxID=1869338 RepID=UPI002F9320D2